MPLRFRRKILKVKDVQLAVYQIHKNKYPKIEISRVLHISDAEVEMYFEENRKHERLLKKLDEEWLSK